nr:unnamed protein product [Naegleria fowleri]
MLSALTPPIHSSKKKKHPSSSTRKQQHYHHHHYTPNRNKGTNGNIQNSVFSSPPFQSSVLAHPEDSMIFSDDVPSNSNNNNNTCTSTNNSTKTSEEDKDLKIEEYLMKQMRLKQEQLTNLMNQMVEQLKSHEARNCEEIDQIFQAMRHWN